MLLGLARWLTEVNWDRCCFEKRSANRALDVRDRVSREVLLVAIGKALERLEQAIIALLNQIQNVNAIVLVPLRDRHDHVQVRFDERFSAVVCLFILGADMSDSIRLFLGSQRRNFSHFPQIDSHGIVAIELVFHAGPFLFASLLRRLTRPVPVLLAIVFFESLIGRGADILETFRSA